MGSSEIGQSLMALWSPVSEPPLFAPKGLITHTVSTGLRSGTLTKHADLAPPYAWVLIRVPRLQ